MGRAQNITMNVFVPRNCEFQISKLFYALKQTNEKGRQSFRGFPEPEITWKLCVRLFYVSPVKYGSFLFDAAFCRSL